MTDWRDRLRGDPLPWLLDEADPAVRHLALRDLLGRDADDRRRADACEAATRSDPIAAMLAAQDPAGWWEKPGPGYGPKYRGTVWSLIFLDQLGADPDEPRVRAACEYVLAHSQARTGGFACSAVASEKAPPARARPALPHRQPAPRAHRLRLARRRAGRAGHRLAGGGDHRRGRPTLECRHAGARLPLRRERWAALRLGCGEVTAGPGPDPVGPALARRRPGDRGLRRFPAVPRSRHRRLPDGLRQHQAERIVVPARLPVGLRHRRPPGARSARRGRCRTDPRLAHALDWLLAQQDDEGRWANRYAYAGKMVVDIDVPGAPSRWVTLRACRVLRTVS